MQISIYAHFHDLAKHVQLLLNYAISIIPFVRSYVRPTRPTDATHGLICKNTPGSAHGGLLRMATPSSTLLLQNVAVAAAAGTKRSLVGWLVLSWKKSGPATLCSLINFHLKRYAWPSTGNIVQPVEWIPCLAGLLLRSALG